MNGDRYEVKGGEQSATWKKMLPRLGKTRNPFSGGLRRCFVTVSHLRAGEDAGFKTLNAHAKRSPDLNAVENAWDLLQDRLLLTAPVQLEALRQIVGWMDQNARKSGRALRRDQKKRATQVKKLKGARCSFWHAGACCWGCTEVRNFDMGSM